MSMDDEDYDQNPEPNCFTHEIINCNQTKAPTIAALIPAYNEAGRIGKVITVLCRVPSLDEIIIIDDGSRDNTALEAHQVAPGNPRVRVIQHKENLGKGQALVTGWQATQATYLLMLDADLINLTPQHVQALILPVVRGQADMTLGLFRDGYWRTDISHWLTPWLSGQRCLRSDLLSQVPLSAASGYGFETALSLVSNRHGWRCQRVRLQGVSHPPGEIPRGGWHGPRTKLKMYAHIIRAWFLIEDWQQITSRFIRRLRLIIFLLLTFSFSLVNNCSTAIHSVPARLAFSWLNDDTFWLLWWKIKAALDLLP